MSRPYIKKTLRAFDVNPEVKTQDVAIAHADIVIGTPGFNNVKSGTAIYCGAETENKTISLYPILQ